MIFAHLLTTSLLLAVLLAVSAENGIYFGINECKRLSNFLNSWLPSTFFRAPENLEKCRLNVMLENGKSIFMYLNNNDPRVTMNIAGDDAEYVILISNNKNDKVGHFHRYNKNVLTHRLVNACRKIQGENYSCFATSSAENFALQLFDKTVKASQTSMSLFKTNNPSDILISATAGAQKSEVNGKNIEIEWNANEGNHVPHLTITNTAKINFKYIFQTLRVMFREAVDYEADIVTLNSAYDLIKFNLDIQISKTSFSVHKLSVGGITVHVRDRKISGSAKVFSGYTAIYLPSDTKGMEITSIKVANSNMDIVHFFSPDRSKVLAEIQYSYMGEAIVRTNLILPLCGVEIPANEKHIIITNRRNATSVKFDTVSQRAIMQFLGPNFIESTADVVPRLGID